MKRLFFFFSNFLFKSRQDLLNYKLRKYETLYDFYGIIAHYMLIFFILKILEWLRAQSSWDFSEMDFLMLITAYGKQGDFNKAERILSFMNKKGYVPSVVSHTALMEAYGRGG